MIVAGASAQFGLPETLRGILAGAGGMFRLPRVIPRPIAVEMMTSGKRLGAARAFELGLVNEVVADDQIMAAALALAERVAAAAPLAVQESLTMIRAAADHDEAVLWDMSLAASARVSASEDAKEGPRAFKEKRPPVWTGR
jgi:enoyl-CoA hydratase/carnithine racemase